MACTLSVVFFFSLAFGHPSLPVCRLPLFVRRDSPVTKKNEDIITVRRFSYSMVPRGLRWTERGVGCRQMERYWTAMLALALAFGGAAGVNGQRGTGHETKHQTPAGERAGRLQHSHRPFGRENFAGRPSPIRVHNLWRAAGAGAMGKFSRGRGATSEEEGHGERGREGGGTSVLHAPPMAPLHLEALTAPRSFCIGVVGKHARWALWLSPPGWEKKTLQKNRRKVHAVVRYVQLLRWRWG